jgi:uncharacterized DUF497 family protein
MEFEWDPKKADYNLKKHRVDLAKPPLFLTTLFRLLILTLTIQLRKTVILSWGYQPITGY